MPGLKPLREENRHGALYGILERPFGRYSARLLGQRCSVVVGQRERQWTDIRERVLAWRMGSAAM